MIMQLTLAGKVLLKVFCVVLGATGLVIGVALVYYTYFREPRIDVPFGAAYLGDSESLAEWLAAGGDPNLHSSDGWPLICIAIESPKSSFQVVETLLDFGADPNAQVEGGLSALALAASANYRVEYIRTMEILVESGADVQWRCPDGDTLLDIIAGPYADESQRKQAQEIVEQLVNISDGNHQRATHSRDAMQ